MKISKLLLVIILAISTYAAQPCLAQSERQALAEATKTLAESNLRTLQEYNCNMALIQYDRSNILDRLNGRTPSRARYDSMIAKATECLTSDGVVVAYFYRAKAYSEIGNSNSALNDYEQALKVSATKPNNVITPGSIYLERADLYIRLLDKQHAEADLRNAIKADPGSTTAKDKLDHLAEKMEEAHIKAILANPQTAADYVVVGAEMDKMGKYAAAVTAFDKSIALAPGKDAYLGKAKALQALKRPSEALVAINDAAARAAKDPEVLTWRGHINRDLKRWAEAIDDYTKAMKPGKADAGLLILRGNAYTQTGNFPAAYSDFDAAVNSGSDSYNRLTALAGKGSALAAQGKSAEALKIFNDNIAGAGTDFMSMLALYETYMGRGRLYARTGQKTLAEADFKKAISLIGKSEEATAELAKLSGASPALGGTLEGKNAEQWSNEGRTLFSKRDYNAAIAAFDKSIQLEPGNAFYYTLRGFANGSAGNDDAFRTDFEKAEKLAPRDLRVYFLRGTVYQMKGNRAAAINDYRRVLELDPKHEAAQQRLKDLGS